ncbi:DUF4492 domain-containing protein [Desulfoplanes sp. PS50]
MPSFVKNMCSLYVDGFRSMVLGRTLWKIILVKLVVIFGVIKIFFFPDFLATTYATDQERTDHVLSALTMDTNDPSSELLDTK